MAWILRYILCITLISTLAVEVVRGSFGREGKSAANLMFNASYKNLNEKPHVTKRELATLILSKYELGKLKVTWDYKNVKIPKECKRIGICDIIPNYPEEFVATLFDEYEMIKVDRLIYGMDFKSRLELQKINMAKSVALQDNFKLLSKKNIMDFNVDVLDQHNETAPETGSDEETVDLCEKDERIFIPQYALDENMNWRLILNEKKIPKQQFSVEICNDKGSPCSLAAFPNGYESRCVQKFILRPMYSYNGEKDVVEKNWFNVPSCCSCIAVRT